MMHSKRQVAAVAEIVTEVLRAEYSGVRGGADQLALDAGGTTRSAQNWLQGVTVPRAENLLVLMHTCPGIRRVVDELVEDLLGSTKKRAGAASEAGVKIPRCAAVVRDAKAADRSPAHRPAFRSVFR